ncbi:hypothetical protein N7495_002067 [Penicillium taxi]|uniref:uncharacterized protein n=1 Tax=Penicillium taxi TaxID=168475 RepID=UPI0025452172|nr:uncharacterized protein N7495_002067 [Penicillium taxi]KAJ5901539.1 hypothetical protein N7495_002067 [Penicillium taxi]
MNNIRSVGMLRYPCWRILHTELWRHSWKCRRRLRNSRARRNKHQCLNSMPHWYKVLQVRKYPLEGLFYSESQSQSQGGQVLVPDAETIAESGLILELGGRVAHRGADDLGQSRNLREQEALAEESALKLLPKLNAEMVSVRD